MNNSSSDNSFQILFTATNGASVLVCVVATILLLALHLYTKVVYRLALYQVLAALAFATVQTLQVVFVNYDVHVCVAMGWLTLFTLWTKLVSTCWATFYLFCFAVLHKNLKKLEVLYVVTSLLVPAGVASVPLISDTYGRSPHGLICYIFVQNDSDSANAFIETLGLWDGPATLVLLLASVAMAVMMMKITHSCWKLKCRSYEPIAEGDQFGKAVKQLLPLAAFPILFFVFVLPVIVLDTYTVQHTTVNKTLLLFASLFISLWSMASGVTLIIHVSLTRIHSRRRTMKHKDLMCLHRSGNATIRPETGSHVNSATSFPLPADSIVDVM